MANGFFIGIDIGTSETKGTLVNTEGLICRTGVRRHGLSIPAPGRAEHDPETVWWREVCEIIREFLTETDPREILGICVSAVSCGLTPVSEGKALRPAILYGIDTRSIPQTEEILKAVGEEKLLEICGELPSVDSYGPKLLWLRENEPEIFEKAEAFTFAQGYVNLKLTGENCIDTYSVFFSTPLYDYKNGNWNPELAKLVLGDKSISSLPRIAPASEKIGTVTTQASLETGLCPGTPVFCGTTDAGAEALSVGVFAPGDMMVMYGSTLFLNCVTPEVIVKGNPLWKANSLLGKNGCILSGMATTGSLTKWLRDEFGKDLLQHEDPYGALFGEAAETAPGADGLLVLPYFAGERMPVKDPQAKGMFFGLDLHHKRGHVVRAALEGIGYGLRQNLSVLRDMGVPVKELTAVGGGTKSRVFLQIMADVTQTVQHVPEITVGASFGDAMLCALGTGIVKDPEELRAWNPEKECVYPDPEKASVYEKGSVLYRALYESTKQLMHGEY